MGDYKDSDQVASSSFLVDDAEFEDGMKDDDTSLTRWSKSTMKRELAVAAQLLWWGLVLFGVFGKSVEAAEAATNMQIVVWAYTGAAFGLDAYSKQIAVRR